jgi:hypothetical protein
MQPTSDGHQITLANVHGEDSDGQIELVEPGPRAEIDEQHSFEIDARQGVLPGVPGVRVGARWRRDSAEGAPVSWSQLSLRLAGIAQHRGRRWNAGDVATMRNVEMQTWGIVECNDRKLVTPEWLRVDRVDAPDGELVLTRNPNCQKMLSWVWAAFEAGAGGVRLTRDQWAELLCCSPRSVFNHWKRLEAAGLIVRVQTYAPAQYKGEIVPGSWDAAWIVRIGPELERVALAAFERFRVKFPKGFGIRRAHAHAVAVGLRQSVRTRGRSLQGELADRRRRYAGTPPRESTVDATRAVQPPTRPADQRHRRPTAERCEPSSAQPSMEARCVSLRRAASPP